MISVLLHKTNDSEWTDEELSPLKKISIMEITSSKSVMGAKIILYNNKEYEVDFNNIDGYKSC